MNPPNQIPVALNSASIALGLAVLLGIAGCASESDARYGGYGGSGGYRRPVQVVQQSSYVYYPDYELYYNSMRGEYVYFDGRGWITTRQPPRRWARDLRRAPYVQLDFYDSPDRHHNEVVRRYPHHWRGDRDNRRDRDDRRYDR